MIVTNNVVLTLRFVVLLHHDFIKFSHMLKLIPPPKKKGKGLERVVVRRNSNRYFHVLIINPYGLVGAEFNKSSTTLVLNDQPN